MGRGCRAHTRLRQFIYTHRGSPQSRPGISSTCTTLRRRAPGMRRRPPVSAAGLQSHHPPTARCVPRRISTGWMQGRKPCPGHAVLPQKVHGCEACYAPQSWLTHCRFVDSSIDPPTQTTQRLAAAASGDFIYLYDSSNNWVPQTSAFVRNWRSIASSADGSVRTHETITALDMLYCICCVCMEPTVSTFGSCIFPPTFIQKLAAGADNGFVVTYSSATGQWVQQTSAGQRPWRAITFSANDSVRCQTNPPTDLKTGGHFPPDAMFMGSLSTELIRGS
jgi:hypothetical protein